MKVRLVFLNGDSRNGDVVEEDVARRVMAQQVRTKWCNLVTKESCDGSRVYCYGTQKAADYDVDGAYAPGWEYLDDDKIEEDPR